MHMHQLLGELLYAQVLAALAKQNDTSGVDAGKITGILLDGYKVGHTVWSMLCGAFVFTRRVVSCWHSCIRLMNSVQC